MSKEVQKSQKLKKVAECLYRNGNDIYFALIKVKGKQIKKSLKTTDRPIANRRLAELRQKAQRLTGSDGRNILFEEIAASWLESINSNLKPASLRRRVVSVNGLTPFFKGHQIRSVTFTHIEEWKKKRGGVVSPRSHNIELETLTLIFKYAMDRGILLENPASKFKRRKQAHKEIETYTKDQFSLVVRTLRAASQSVASGSADMVEFLAYSGMRVGEAKEVLIKDIYLATNHLKISGGEGGTKNHHERTIPIFPSLKTVIQRILERRSDSKPTERLFNVDSPRGALKLAHERCGLPHFTVHSLRHFFITNALEQGITPKTIAGWVGHSDGGILVAKTYGHLRKEFSEDVAQRMTFRAVI